MRTIIFSTAAAAILTLAAMPAQAEETWTGPYIGGHLGYGFQPGDNDETIRFDKNLDGQFNDTVLTSGAANAFSPGFCGGAAATATPTGGCSNDGDGIDVGIRAGYDWQFGNWVVGGLGELSYTDIDDSVSAFSTTPARYTMTRELKWSASARGRRRLCFRPLSGLWHGGRHLRQDRQQLLDQQRRQHLHPAAGRQGLGLSGWRRP